MFIQVTAKNVRGGFFGTQCRIHCCNLCMLDRLLGRWILLIRLQCMHGPELTVGHHYWMSKLMLRAVCRQKHTRRGRVWLYADVHIHNWSVNCWFWLGGRKDIQPVKTEWWGASMVICLELGVKWFAYGPADATATPSSLASVNPEWFCVSGAGLPRSSWKHVHFWSSGCVVCPVTAVWLHWRDHSCIVSDQHSLPGIEDDH